MSTASPSCLSISSLSPEVGFCSTTSTGGWTRRSGPRFPPSSARSLRSRRSGTCWCSHTPATTRCEATSPGAGPTRRAPRLRRRESSPKRRLCWSSCGSRAVRARALSGFDGTARWSASPAVSPGPQRGGTPRVDCGSCGATDTPPDLWVVVDDNSTDRSPEILTRLAERISFLKVVTASAGARP